MSWIVNDIKEALKKYSKLKLIKKQNIVKGDIDIINPKTKRILDSYSLIISFPNEYPFTKLPIVKEIDGKIPRSPDRHIYEDGGFCLTAPIQELLICKQGINFTKFLDKIVVPFLASQLAISLGWLTEFPQGEFSHGDKGIYESYCDFFKISDVEKIIAGIKISMQRNQRNSICFCGSKNKLKKCHLQKVMDLRGLGKSKLLSDLKTMEKLL